MSKNKNHDVRIEEIRQAIKERGIELSFDYTASIFWLIKEKIITNISSSDAEKLFGKDYVRSGEELYKSWLKMVSSGEQQDWDADSLLKPKLVEMAQQLIRQFGIKVYVCKSNKQKDHYQKEQVLL